MSIVSSLYQGVSGLNSNAAGIESVGNNIANVNTVGYKASRVSFEELLGRTIIGGAATGQLGAGSGVSSVQKVFTQGSFLSTGVSTDLAIAGEGFFMVNGDMDGTNGNFYTRAGQFGLDPAGNLVTSGGLKVQGFQIGPDGVPGQKLGDLEIPVAPLQPKTTTDIQMGVGLDASTPARVAPLPAIDPNDPTSFDFQTSVTVYDSLGAGHSVNVYFQKGADNSWSYSAQAEGSEIDGTAGLVEVGSGTLEFTTDGYLNAETGAPIDVTFQGAAAQSIALDFGNSIAEGGTGQSQTVQYDDRVSQALSIEQDGHSTGTLQTIDFDSDGNIIGAYSNGEDVVLGRLALARFGSNTGLENVGGNFFRETVHSGQPVVGQPNAGGRGALASGTLEQSNVDLAAEFVNMITAQRGYQANSRTITTVDQMYAETVNLKN
jgi:flagellar hook protein FlgE